MRNIYTEGNEVNLLLELIPPSEHSRKMKTQGQKRLHDEGIYMSSKHSYQNYKINIKKGWVVCFSIPPMAELIYYLIKTLTTQSSITGT